MLVYQYVYYWMLEIDRGKLSEMTSRYKALFVYMVIEIWGLGAIYTLVANIVLGLPIHKSATIPIVWILVFVFAMLYVNRRLLGSKDRTDQYKKIFDGWDKWKRARWKLYVVFIAVSVFAIMMLVVQASRKMLVP